MAIPASALASATQLVNAGRYPEASTLLERHCAQRPDDLQGRFLLALARRATGDAAGAEQAVGAILSAPRASIQHLAGLIARDLGAVERAAARFRRALLCDPGHPGAWKGLAGLQMPGDSALSRYSAAAAIVDPRDSKAWNDLVFAILFDGEPRLAKGGRPLLAEALRHVSVEVRWVCGFVFGLPNGDAVTPSATLETSETERALVRLVEQAAIWFRDHPSARAILGDRLRHHAVSSPHARAPWLADLVLHNQTASPVEGALLRRLRRVVAFGQLPFGPVDLTRPFEACVAAKGAAMATAQFKMLPAVVGHALGLQALCEAVNAPVEVLWTGDQRRVRIGDRSIGYRLTSPSVTGFVARLFLFEPGLWRWMAGFQPDDTFLDIGANIGVYSVAAAGLFGVQVAALEPYAPNLETLRTNVAVNRLGDRVIVLPVAATDVERTGRLFHEGGEAGAAAQHFEGEEATGEASQPFATVEGVPVDRLIERGAIPFPSRVKIDVDGNERAVIEGMAATLADPRLHSVRLEVRWRQPEGRAVVERVQSFGFRATVGDDQKNLLFIRSPGSAKSR